MMSRTFTSKTATTSCRRGRGSSTTNFGRGSIINRGEKADQTERSGFSNSNPSGTGSPAHAGRGVRGTKIKRGGVINRGLSRGTKMYDDDDDFNYQQPQPNRNVGTGNARTRNVGYQRAGTQTNPGTSASPGNTSSNPSTQDRITQASGFMMVSPNEKKRREITQQAKKNLEDYERHKEERKLQHVSYIGTAGGGQISEQEARRKAAVQHSTAPLNSRIKREAERAAEKEREEQVYRERKTAARRQSELNEERRKREDEKMEIAHKEEMRRKNAAFLDRLESKKPQTISTKQETSKGNDTPRAKLVKQTTTKTEGASPLYPVSDDHQQDLNRLQIMFPHYTRNDLSELLQQMGSLELTIDILSE